MQRVTVVRYTTKPDHTAENEALSSAVFAQLRSAPPEGVAYALFRDGNEFIHVFLNLKADRICPSHGVTCFQDVREGHRRALRSVSECDTARRAVGGLLRLRCGL